MQIDEKTDVRRTVIELVDDEETSLTEVPEEEAQAEEKPAGGINAKISELIRWGTPVCSLLCGLLGLGLAILMLTLGFWKAILIGLLFGGGLMFGGVTNKTRRIKRLINRLFPPKNEN